MLRLPGWHVKKKKKKQSTRIHTYKYIYIKIYYYIQVMLTLSKAIRPPTPTTSKETQHPCGLAVPLTSFDCRNTNRNGMQVPRTHACTRAHTHTPSADGEHMCEAPKIQLTNAAEWFSSSNKNMMSNFSLRLLQDTFCFRILPHSNQHSGEGSTNPPLVQKWPGIKYYLA